MWKFLSNLLTGIGLFNVVAAASATQEASTPASALQVTQEQLDELEGTLDDLIASLYDLQSKVGSEPPVGEETTLFNTIPFDRIQSSTDPNSVNKLVQALHLQTLTATNTANNVKNEISQHRLAVEGVAV